MKVIAKINSSQDGVILDTDGISQTLNSGHFNVPKILIKTNTIRGGWQIADVGDSINLSMPNSKTRRGRVGKKVAQTLDTQSQQAVVVAQRGRGEIGNTSQQLELRNDGNTNTLTGVQKDNMLKLEGRIRRLTEIECERLMGFKDNHTQYGCYPTKKVTQKQMNAMSNEDLIKLFQETTVKKIPRGQRYKLVGNAVTTKCVAAIGRKLILNEK